jgi:hypothetical protein
VRSKGKCFEYKLLKLNQGTDFAGLVMGRKGKIIECKP